MSSEEQKSYIQISCLFIFFLIKQKEKQPEAEERRNPEAKEEEILPG